MILNDKQINDLCQTTTPMITPYLDTLVASINKDSSVDPSTQDILKVISFGQSPTGYDLTLSSSEFKIFHRIPGEIVNPKAFNSYSLYNAEKFSDDDGEFFVLPAHTYGLGVTLERLDMPNNVTGVLLTKSTYARCGLINNPTLINPGWKGHLTIEIANVSDSDCRIYANEGIAIAIFFVSNSCKSDYSDRSSGTYQNQPSKIVMSLNSNADIQARI